MTRVLIVDDSLTARLALRKILDGKVGLEVVGDAANRGEALERVRETKPDLVTMDVHLGGEVDGVTLAAEILATAPTRVVIVTGVAPKDPALLFRALAAGALDVLEKPKGAPSADAPRAQSRLTRALAALANVPLPRRMRTPLAPTPTPAPPSFATAAPGPVERVLIGASTGGPPLLDSLLRAVPPPLAVPIVIAQHISAGFGASFAAWLASSTGHRVLFADQPMVLEPGAIYVAPDTQHLHLVARDRIQPGPAQRHRFATPSVDELFESAARVAPRHTLAILLTGMGSDGAAGMATLRAAGAWTIAQTPKTCAVGSMPQSAIDLGGTSVVLDPEAIAARLRTLAVAREG